MDFHLDHVADVARPAFAGYLKQWLHRRVKLLVVVDEEIGLSANPGDFGVGRVIRLLRESSVGCLGFEVDIARRSLGALSEDTAAPATSPRFTGFRFDSQRADGSRIIDGYDEIWCFGFKPHAAFSFPTNDAELDNASSIPATPAELGVLTAWMNAGGGLFGTGDHDFLGAPMCRRIPRLGTMRAWTNAQNVPPIQGPERIDTNRPFNAAEQAGLELIENSRETDSLPQRIQWATWQSVGLPWVVRTRLRRPHPVLCHPTLGPIDVMPDHPHEGAVFDHVAQPDIALAKIKLDGSYAFPGAAGEDYPAVAGIRPLPMVIAYGRTLATPPLRHAKGDIAAKRFGMISVYDGHRIDIGRVATDSTWHHWFNMNLSEIEAAGGDDWEKIRRYFLNLAVWLAPARISRRCWHFHLLEAFYVYPGIEELRPAMHPFELGMSLRTHLVKWFGPCWVTQFILDDIAVIDPRWRETLLSRYFAVPQPKGPFPPRPEPCLSCPQPELIEVAVLGGMAAAIGKALFADGAGLVASLQRLDALSPERLGTLAAEGAKQGLQVLRKEYTQSVKRSQRLLAEIG